MKSVSRYDFSLLQQPYLYDGAFKVRFELIKERTFHELLLVQRLQVKEGNLTNRAEFIYLVLPCEVGKYTFSKLAGEILLPISHIQLSQLEEILRLNDPPCDRF